MKAEDCFLICIYDEKGEVWCVHPKSEPGLIVQVDKLEDAPKELAKLYEAMFTFAFKKGFYVKRTFKPE